MSSWTWGSGKRARRELRRALLSITFRLDALETTPPPSQTPEEIQAIDGAIRSGLTTGLQPLEARLDRLEEGRTEILQKLTDQTLAIDEGILRVGRAERRVDATIKRARKELAQHGYESPGLEVEAAELRLVNGGRSEEGEVPALPEGVEPPVDTPSSIKGVPAETLAKVRGF